MVPSFDNSIRISILVVGDKLVVSISRCMTCKRNCVSVVGDKLVVSISRCKLRTIYQKRGTFIGEISRMATLSSTLTTYCDAVKFVIAMYIRRGYPDDLVHSWAKNYIKKCWAARLSDPAEGDQPLVLKSYYNRAWSYFNVKELDNTIKNYWREYLLRRLDKQEPPSLEYPGTVDGIDDIRPLGLIDRRVLVSRKRNTNLFDHVSAWNKIVLSREQDDNIIEPA